MMELYIIWLFTCQGVGVQTFSLSEEHRGGWEGGTRSAGLAASSPDPHPQPQGPGGPVWSLPTAGAELGAAHRSRAGPPECLT